MTPPAGSASLAPGARAGHRTGLRRGPAPRVPRRVSGPARRPRTAGPAIALPRPGAAPAFGARALRRIAALPDHPLIDRLLRGRLWIGLVAFALIGIVFMQVALLKMNSSIGRAVETASTLQRENATLDAEVSRLSSNDRIQAEARRLGMVLPAAGEVTFLGAGGRRVGGNQALATPSGTATAAPTTTTTTTTPTATGATGTTPATGAYGTATTSGAAATGTGTSTSTSTYGTTGTGTSAYGASGTSTATGTGTSTSTYGTSGTTPSTYGTTHYGTATTPTTSSGTTSYGGQG